MPTVDASTFHMVQLFLDPRRLAELGKMQGLDLSRTSTNYLIHCALGELFGDDAPKPFYVDDDPRTVEGTAAAHGDRHVRVLGYADLDDDALREEAKLCPNPTVSAICDWDRFVASEMPTRLAEGRRLQFELRACPVVRKASAGEGENRHGERRTWEAGDELDAFLARAWANPEADLRREDVYRDWLCRQFDERGGAAVEDGSIRMTRFSIERMTRRTHDTGDATDGGDRTVNTLKRPDVTLTGTLEVTDADAFPALLRRGIGRHKSFGYGMLKVRRHR
jgi:CRISPR system Cascade subunit CasE